MRHLIGATLASAAVLFVGAQAQASPNLLTNGSFESGLTGWSTFGDFKYSGVANPAFDVSDLNGQHAQDGLNQVYLGSIGDTGGIFQTVADTKGMTYDVTGWYSGQGSLNPAQFAENRNSPWYDVHQPEPGRG